MKAVKSAFDFIIKITGMLLILLLCGLVFFVLLGVFYRLAMYQSNPIFIGISSALYVRMELFPNPEEMIRILLVWLAFLGLVYLYGKDLLLRCGSLPVKGALAKPLWYLQKLCCLAFGAFLLLSVTQQYPKYSAQRFPAINWMPYSILLLPVALAGGFIVLFTVCQLIDRTGELLRHEPQEERGGEL